MGRTTLAAGAAPLLRLRGADGSEHDGGAFATTAAGPNAASVCGPYLHGPFDHAALRAAFLNRPRAARGLSLRSSAAPPPADDLDRLADHVEAHLDTGLLERIVRL